MKSFFATLLVTCSLVAAAADARPVDTVPMYGQPGVSRPEVLRNADEDFIREATAGLGSREAAAKAWHAQAERFMQQRDFDMAMRRYNQAWLLQPSSYLPHWGFGRVMMERGAAEEASRHLEQALQLVDDAFQKPALLADLGTAYSIRAQLTASTDTAETARLFALANDGFSQSTGLDPSYASGWRRWAISLYEQGEYGQAWEKVREARARKARPFPPAFLRALQAKHPEPR
ncbi:MAG TPA: hypothetical protein VF522_07000 [Ramlibacter sp.]|uniref:hypothetical protein n=1 Tax=Ramlibacter sp. TaxID=1917967 RepID=UPI002ED67C56